MENGDTCRRRAHRCYSELSSAPCSLNYNGQVITLSSHLWRECPYRDIANKEDDRDLSGLSCIAWMVHRGLPLSGRHQLPEIPELGLRIHRIWVINQHDCQVFASKASPLSRVGHIHTWGPTLGTAADVAGARNRISATSPHHSAGTDGATVPCSCTAGVQYTTIRQGPCWELCTSCDVVAQLVDVKSGREVGLLKGEEQLVSAEVVFSWLDLLSVVLKLLVLAMQLLTSRPCSLICLQLAQAWSCMQGRMGRLGCMARTLTRSAMRLVSELAGRASRWATQSDPKPLQLTDAANTGTAAATSRASATMAPVASTFSLAMALHPTQLSTLLQPAAATPSSLSLAVATHPAAADTLPSAPATPLASFLALPSASTSPPDAIPAAPQWLGLTAANLPPSSRDAGRQSSLVMLLSPEWSGRVVTRGGTMRSAVVFTAVVSGIVAAVLATGITKLLAELLDMLSCQWLAVQNDSC